MGKLRRQSSAAVAAVVLVAGLSYTSAAADDTTNRLGQSAFEVTDSSSTDAALDGLAKRFAVALHDQQLREATKATALQRFDGDTEALYETLSIVRLPDGQTYGDRLVQQTAMATGESATAVEDSIETAATAVPSLQVAVRGPIDSWDTATYVPWVTYGPTTVDDLAVTTLTAYDAGGQAHIVDAVNEPTQPIIVLGINERTDANGALLPGLVTASDEAAGLEPAAEDFAPLEGECGTRPKVWERIVGGLLTDDFEPWWGGGPELKLELASPVFRSGFWEGYVRTADFTGPTFFLAPTSLFGWGIRIHGNWVMWFWREEDPPTGSRSWSGTFGGITVTITTRPEDDRIGRAVIPITDRYQKTTIDLGKIIWTRWSCG